MNTPTRAEKIRIGHLSNRQVHLHDHLGNTHLYSCRKGIADDRVHSEAYLMYSSVAHIYRILVRLLVCPCGEHTKRQ